MHQKLFGGQVPAGLAAWGSADPLAALWAEESRAKGKGKAGREGQQEEGRMGRERMGCAPPEI